MCALFSVGEVIESTERSAFRALLERDNAEIFLNLEEFGERRTVRYDGESYEEIPVVLDEAMQTARYNIKHLKSDYGQGLHKGAVRLHCMRRDLGNKLPEQGMPLEIESERRNGFFRKYEILESRCDEGMLTVTLERVDE
jgi:hypothetical protein